MKNRLRMVLWIALLITLIMSCQGFLLRTGNEKINNRVVLTAEYQLFEKNAQTASLSMDSVLQRLQQQGAKTITVKETTLRDLSGRGEIYIQTMGEFTAFTQRYQPEVWSQASQAIGQRYISPANLVIVASNPEILPFLQEKLQNRFSPNELLRFQAQGKQYFIINAELEQLDRSKNAVKQLDTQLGFEEKILDQLQAKGFELILRPGYTTGSNTAYLLEYEPLIRKYSVHTIIFAYNRVTGSPAHLEVMEKLVNKYHLTIGIIETAQQLGYLSQEGLDELMYSTGYPINRVYSTANDDFVTTVNERYYRWVRAIVDRGIRILYIVPFKDESKSASVNLNDTIETIGELQQTIAAKGFHFAQPAVFADLNNEIPGAGHRLWLSLSLLLAGLLYLDYLLAPQRKWILGLGGLGILACAGINLLLGADFSKVYALAAAILYPVLSSLLLLRYLKKNPSHNFIIQFFASLAIILGINAMGMYTVASSLADIRYIMNIGYFSGVKLAFIVPLLLFPLNYLSATVKRQDWIPSLRGWLQESPTYLILGLAMIALLGLYIYVGRSGNTSGIEVSSLEIRTREILEMIFLARPRFKEFMIGYPALLAMVYLYQKYHRDFILFLLGFGVMIGSISMVNSFCHVFTAVAISAKRTLAGLLTGLVVGLAVLICIWIIEKIMGKYRHANTN